MNILSQLSRYLFIYNVHTLQNVNTSLRCVNVVNKVVFRKL